MGSLTSVGLTPSSIWIISSFSLFMYFYYIHLPPISQFKVTLSSPSSILKIRIDASIPIVKTLIWFGFSEMQIGFFKLILENGLLNHPINLPASNSIGQFSPTFYFNSESQSGVWESILWSKNKAFPSRPGGSPTSWSQKGNDASHSAQFQHFPCFGARVMQIVGLWHCPILD